MVHKAAKYGVCKLTTMPFVSAKKKDLSWIPALYCGSKHGPTKSITGSFVKSRWKHACVVAVGRVMRSPIHQQNHQLNLSILVLGPKVKKKEQHKLKTQKTVNDGFMVLLKLYNTYGHICMPTSNKIVSEIRNYPWYFLVFVD